MTGFMAAALASGLRARGRTSPNPAVGAVVVRDGAVVGEGWTQPPGGAHAEVMALENAGNAARGAALFVTLEPCCVVGRTPPCTDAIIAAGVREVHFACPDPHPMVRGRGRQELERAGIAIFMGEDEATARKHHEAFFHSVATGRPFVIAKYAMTLDGRIATAGGDSRWVSGEGSRRWVHRLRDAVDAIVVGVNTVLTDDPELTARPAGVPAAARQPLRVILDSTARCPATARLLRCPGRTLVACTADAPVERLRELARAGAELLVLPSADGRVALGPLMHLLGRRGVVSLLAEGGSAVLGAFLNGGYVNKVHAFVAPTILGGAGLAPVSGRGQARMADAWRLRDPEWEGIGEDVLVTGYLDGRSGRATERRA